MIIAFFNIVLFVLIAIIAYLLSKKFESKYKMKKILYYFDERYKARMFDKKINKVYRKKEKKLMAKFDKLIYSSGIRKHFKYMTSEIFMIFTLIMVVGVAAIVYLISSSAIFSCVTLIIVPVAFYTVLREMARINFDKIDNSIMFFISSLKNSANIKNNILFMMEETADKLKDPLKTHNYNFVREVKRGIPIQEAFDNYISKVENIRLKNILRNLYICSINNANYSKLLDKTRIVVRNYYEEKEKRQRKVRTVQIGIVFIILVSIVIINALSGITQNFYRLLFYTGIGQILVGYITGVIIFAIYRCIVMKEFNY